MLRSYVVQCAWQAANTVRRSNKNKKNSNRNNHCRWHVLRSVPGRALPLLYPSSPFLFSTAFQRRALSRASARCMRTGASGRRPFNSNCNRKVVPRSGRLSVGAKVEKWSPLVSCNVIRKRPYVPSSSGINRASLQCVPVKRWNLSCQLCMRCLMHVSLHTSNSASSISSHERHPDNAIVLIYLEHLVVLYRTVVKQL